MKLLKLNRFYCFLLLIVLNVTFSVFAQQIDTLTIYSPKMNTGVKNIVILPESYNQKLRKRYPVVFLLHGYGGNHLSWLNTVKPTLPQLADKYQFIIVCPDGKNSWYWDSPLNPKSQYETYVSSELIKYLDKNYRTIDSPQGRAITGFSMGGHGALWLTLKHPDVFGVCGSLSGAVDIRPFPHNWNLSEVLGKYPDNKKLLNSHTVFTNADKLRGIPLIMDCGEGDFFLEVNRNLHKTLVNKNIEHKYIETPGKHNPDYWRKTIDWHLDFFNDFFKKNKLASWQK